MIQRLNTFMLKDTPFWNIEKDLKDLSFLAERNGILFWCRYGEWRAVGGPQLTTIVNHLRQHSDLRQAYIVADLAPLAPDQAYAYDEWDNALMVPSELVRWLRYESEQLGETDTTTESATE